MKIKFLLVTLLFSAQLFSQPTGLTTIGNWNAYVYNPGKTAPVLLFFHGNGEAGSNANNLLKNGLPQILSQGFKPPFDLFIICPQDGWGSFPTTSLPALLSEIKKKYPQANTNEVYVTGLSAGGLTAFNAIKYIDVKGIFPMSASGTDNSLITTIANKNIPVIFWVGDAEQSYKGISEWAHHLLKQSGANSTLNIRKGVTHCCWNDIYKSNDFWNYFKPVLKPVHKVTTNLLQYSLPKGSWGVDSTTIINGLVGVDKLNRLYVMASTSGEIYLSAPDADHTLQISFRYTPPPPTPVLKEILRLTYGSKVTQIIYDNHTYTGDKVILTITCKDGSVLKLNPDGTWQ